MVMVVMMTVMGVVVVDGADLPRGLREASVRHPFQDSGRPNGRGE
jgi:hypothetical protein